MVKNLAENFMIGVDRMKSESLWDDMFTKIFRGKGGGTMVYAGISALDSAL